MKIQKKKIWGGGGVWREGSGWGGQGGCERRTEVFVQIQKKKKWGGSGGWGWGGGVRVDENEELKFLWKFKKKKIFLGGGGGRGRVGGVRVDVNEELKFL